MKYIAARVFMAIFIVSSLIIAVGVAIHIFLDPSPWSNQPADIKWLLVFAALLVGIAALVQLRRGRALLALIFFGDGVVLFSRLFLL